MKSVHSLLLVITFLLAGCAQYRCYDGTYVEDAYDCFNHGGLSYFSRAARPSKTLSGNWAISGTVTSKSCPTLNNNVGTSTKITQQSNGMVTIRSLSGFGSGSAKLQKNRAKFSIRKNFFLYAIQGSVDANFASHKNSAQLSGKGTVKFLGGKTCDISLSARAVRQ